MHFKMTQGEVLRVSFGAHIANDNKPEDRKQLTASYEETMQSLLETRPIAEKEEDE